MEHNTTKSPNKLAHSVSTSYPFNVYLEKAEGINQNVQYERPARLDNHSHTLKP